VAVIIIDAKGLKCPQPTIQMTIQSPQDEEGRYTRSGCRLFHLRNDVKNWCRRNNRPLLWLRDEGDGRQTLPGTVLDADCATIYLYCGRGMVSVIRLLRRRDADKEAAKAHAVR